MSGVEKRLFLLHLMYYPYENYYLVNNDRLPVIIMITCRFI